MAKARSMSAAGVALFALTASAQVPYTFSGGTAAKASEVNANFDYIWMKVFPSIASPNGNTPLGFNALGSNPTGNANTAVGNIALSSNTSASQNTGVGAGALMSNMVGSYNTAVGTNTLKLSTGAANTAVGAAALGNLVTGWDNTALGGSAGVNILLSRNVDIQNNGEPSDEGVIRIGRSDWHVRTFLAGIYGVQTGGPGTPVVIDANGQLGTISSSRRFKQDIRDLGADSADLRKLRPVAFRYKQPQSDGSRPLHYGLIAEEVAEVYPGLVAYDRDSKEPQTVLYQELPVMLLNELNKQRMETEKQRQTVEELRREVEKLKASLGRR